MKRSTKIDRQVWCCPFCCGAGWWRLPNPSRYNRCLNRRRRNSLAPQPPQQPGTLKADEVDAYGFFTADIGLFTTSLLERTLLCSA